MQVNFQQIKDIWKNLNCFSKISVVGSATSLSIEFIEFCLKKILGSAANNDVKNLARAFTILRTSFYISNITSSLANIGARLCGQRQHRIKLISDLLLNAASVTFYALKILQLKTFIKAFLTTIVFNAICTAHTDWDSTTQPIATAASKNQKLLLNTMSRVVVNFMRVDPKKFDIKKFLGDIWLFLLSL